MEIKLFKNGSLVKAFERTKEFDLKGKIPDLDPNGFMTFETTLDKTLKVEFYLRRGDKYFFRNHTYKISFVSDKPEVRTKFKKGQCYDFKPIP